jgi:hypothetical protein
MAGFENWAVAFDRIRNEVRAEDPTRDPRDQYLEYRRRCDDWKRERGIPVAADAGGRDE